MKTQIVKVCQVCGHEEDLKECPECTRHTCQSCFDDMNKQGIVGQKCLYCDHIFFMPERQPTKESQMLDLDRPDAVPNPTYDMEPVTADRYSRQLNRALADEDIQPGDPVVEHESGEVGVYRDVPFRASIDSNEYRDVPFRVRSLSDIQTDPQPQGGWAADASRYQQRNKIIYDKAKGKLWTISKALDEIEECQGMAYASVFKLFKGWLERGRALMKPRAYENKDAWYVLTDQELEDKGFVEPTAPSQISRINHEPFSSEYESVKINIMDENGDPFNLEGAIVSWGGMHGIVDNPLMGEIKFIVTRENALTFSNGHVEIRKDGIIYRVSPGGAFDQLSMSMPTGRRARQMIDDGDLMTDYLTGRERPRSEQGWAMPSETLTTEVGSPLRKESPYIVGAIIIFMTILGLLLL